MKGKHRIVVSTKRQKYEFELRRNLTILRGDSATGKTTLIEMIQDHENDPLGSPVELISDKKCYVLEGALLGHFRCRFLIATAEWLSAHRQLPVEDITEVSEKELSCASLLKTPQQVLAVFEQPDEVMDASVVAHSLCLALDDVQDPGNLGTIIRLADWFGIEHIFCSPNTVDAYNPKTIQATMGGIARVKLHYTSLPGLIGSLKDIPVYGTLCPWTDSYGE